LAVSRQSRIAAQQSSFPRQVSKMHMTRQRARSSFTVEIKRANKRQTEPARATSSPTGNELVDRVFGSLLGSAAESSKTAEQRGTRQSEAPRQHSAPPSDSESGMTDPSPPRPARRVLPDLLSRDVNPIAERIRQQNEQRTARRRAALESRRSTAQSEHPRAESVRAPVAPQAVIAPAQEEPVPSVQHGSPETAGARTHEKRKQNPRPSVLRKARRSGGDSLPAGERWKRRLPRACW
jgi:hypothetical protein